MDESELDFIFRVSAAGKRPFIGNADEHECRLMRRPGWFSSDYAGIFSAAIFEEQDCTRLDGCFTKVQFGFPLGSRNSKVGSVASIMVSIVALIGFQAYNAIGALMNADHPFLNPPSVVSGVLIAILFVWYLTAIRIKKEQREFILSHVKTVLNASLSLQESKIESSN